MAPDGSMSELGAQVFAVVCNLPPGYHQYKFVVDGEYRHDEAQLLMPDPLGNVNNWLFVKKVDTDTARMYHPNTTARSERGPSLGLKTTTLKHEVCMQSNNPGPVGVVGTMSGPLGVTFGEADASRARILEFLQRHTAYELLPESSKSIVLDTKLPVQQAYLTLHEHAISFAPLWNEESTCFAGMLSVDDFKKFSSTSAATTVYEPYTLPLLLHGSIANLQPFSQSLSEAGLDVWTIEAYKDYLANRGSDCRAALWVGPDDNLQKVAEILLQSSQPAVPVISHRSTRVRTEDARSEAHEFSNHCPQLLHLSSLSNVLACLARHFRGVPAALPLLSQPVGALAIGTWSKSLGGIRQKRESSSASIQRSRDMQQSGCVQLSPVRTVFGSSRFSDALTEMMQADIGAIPIVDERGVLLDVYSRCDITTLAHENAYTRINAEKFSVQQALSLANEARTTFGRAFTAQSPRVHVCTRSDTLRTIVETLSLPGVRRLVCVEPGTQIVEGVISLRDVAAFCLVR
eukprot:CAMPEP_0183794200 /NCGR_PEP_ID=MMETSP0803_2-20130417/3695_1 /TAXON_ID=195967 /ORGANISM="Crustomastix stigmata, Strain CCMP3273" /LENGTH=516 /DNA_ID=CAMNT_0026038599 /DNA_START=243 /DNA_END=1794 /DNA_ORIENTATION=+